MAVSAPSIADQVKEGATCAENRSCLPKVSDLPSPSPQAVCPYPNASLEEVVPRAASTSSCPSMETASIESEERRCPPLLATFPKAAPRTASTSFAKAPAFPPPCHLRLTETSWFGTFDWAHNGTDINGFIELFKNHAMSICFSCMAGRWFEGPEVDEITIEG